MTIESIGSILKVLHRGAAWQQQQQEFDLLVKLWSEVVGATVSQHARPIEIRQGVLQVATSNAVWAQQLRFECPRILAKLNQHLTQPVREIRFSPARWHQRPVLAPEPLSSASFDHPSRRSPPETRDESPSPPVALTPQAAFQRWADKVRARSRGLPLCPQCRCPTPPGELQYWSVCALCAVEGRNSSR
ncbi:MAG TPA: DUF721 domain-containing protein [Oscillatoriales cyanobacterium M59_W2019_021]|nr:DUF721 domain-containing protein [Oscillatoriales cyanobacterium M4454_W2019_049]HIK49558.1 DUF721 domain-containing protein [Oscillatoriales cyanobacterium M59_W2019_021]